MEEIGLVSKYIQQYGPGVVILSIFLVLIFIIIVYFIGVSKKTINSNTEFANTMQKLLEDQIARNAKILEEKKNYDERNIVTIFMELNKALKTACESTMKSSNSDRTAIYVFHNGAHASHGLPFFKLTCISETISKNSNTNSKLEDHTSENLSTFDTIVANLYDNSFHRIILNETTDPCELIFLRSTKIHDCFFIPIYDNDNNIMGFTFNGYNTTSDTRDIETEKEYLVDLAMMAKPVIEYSKFQEYQAKKEEK